MFEQVFENLRTATATTVRMQQELFNRWLNLWPGLAAAGPEASGQLAAAQKQWQEVTGEMLKKQREMLEKQFAAGLKNIEAVFNLAQTKNPEELRERTVELWQKSVNCIREMYETQVRDFQGAVTKWTELLTKQAA
jgi:hypothetical protein